MNAQLKELETAEAVERMTDDELYRKYFSPEAIEHFRDKYPRENRDHG